MKNLYAIIILLGFLSCTENDGKLLTDPKLYTVVTRDNDTLETRSNLSLKSSDNVIIWIWISKTLKGLCGFVLRPYDDETPVPRTDENTYYTVVAATVIPNKLESSPIRLPTKDELQNAENPCDMYIKRFLP